MNKIHSIMRYVKEKYPDAVLEHIPRHNAFGAVLQNDTILPLYYDAAGALQACTGVGNGLEKYGRDYMYICVMSDEYLSLTGKIKLLSSQNTVPVL